MWLTLFQSGYVYVCHCHPASDVSYSFLDALSIWRDRTRRRGVIDDAVYGEMAGVLHQGLTTHYNYNKWKAKYHTKVTDRRPHLYVLEDENSTRLPSGRHAKKQKVDAPVPLSDGDWDRRQMAGLIESPPPHCPQAPKMVEKRVLRLSEVAGVLRQYHEPSHAGFDTLYEKVFAHYHGVTRDMCTGWVKRCAQCSMRMIHPIAPPPSSPTPPSQPAASPPIEPPRIIVTRNIFLDHVYANCVSFDVRRRTTNSSSSIITHHILHFKCLTSKWSELVLLPNKDGSSLRAAFWSIFTRIGSPRRLETDGQPEFMNPEMDQLLLDCGIEDVNRVTNNSVDHHHRIRRTKRVIERSNHILLTMLELTHDHVKYRDRNFEDLVRIIQYWMNTQVHKSIKMSSYQYVFGRIPTLLKVQPPGLQEKMEEKEFETDDDEDDDDGDGDHRIHPDDVDPIELNRSTTSSTNDVLNTPTPSHGRPVTVTPPQPAAAAASTAAPPPVPPPEDARASANASARKRKVAATTLAEM